jgi:hypothetical protein
MCYIEDVTTGQFYKQVTSAFYPVLYGGYIALWLTLVKCDSSLWGQSMASTYWDTSQLTATELLRSGLFSAYRMDEIVISCTVNSTDFLNTMAILRKLANVNYTVRVKYSVLRSERHERKLMLRVLMPRAQGKTRAGQTICLQCIRVVFLFYLFSALTVTCQI